MWDAVFGFRISLSVSQIRLNFSCVLIRSMCFPMILWLIEFLPYLWVVTVPVYGSFCGIDLILRISILLYIYIIAGEIVPKSMVRKAQSCNFTCSHVLMLTNDNLINLYLVIMQTNLKDLINSCRCNRCSFINCKCLIVHVDVRGIYFHSKPIVCFSQYCFLHFLTILKENASVNEVQCKFM